jgi:hypothetical protein
MHVFTRFACHGYKYYIFHFFRLDGVFGPGFGFVVAASRLGNVDTPGWCFVDTPFYPVPGTETVSTNTNPNVYLILVTYPTTKFFIYDGDVVHFACESI